MKVFVLFCAILFARPSFAALGLELLGNYQTDTFTQSTTTTHSQQFFQLNILSDVTRSASFYVAFSTTMVNLSTSGDTTETFSTLDMGPSMMYMFDRKGMISGALGYNILSAASYNDGSASPKWTGTGLWGSLGVMPEVYEDLFIGIKLMYYNASFSKEEVSGASNDIAYSRTLILPLIGMSWRF